jgi:hypothetical protein
MKSCRKIVCSLMPVENHKDGCIHNVATTKMNHEIECHVLGIKVEFPFELIGIPK